MIYVFAETVLEIEDPRCFYFVEIRGTVAFTGDTAYVLGDFDTSETLDGAELSAHWLKIAEERLIETAYAKREADLRRKAYTHE